MYFDSFDSIWWPFAFILLAGALPTAVWRWIGVLLVGNLDESSQWLVLVRCVATALVAAVIAQLIFEPRGALATFPFVLRVGAALFGFVSFLIFGRRLFVGILSAELLLLGGYALL
ncbi:MAG: AzlD domain-containing protein [Rhizobiaceae bacterium]